LLERKICYLKPCRLFICIVLLSKFRQETLTRVLVSEKVFIFSEATTRLDYIILKLIHLLVRLYRPGWRPSCVIYRSSEVQHMELEAILVPKVLLLSFFTTS
jgi:hypothetical protein